MQWGGGWVCRVAGKRQGNVEGEDARQDIDHDVHQGAQHTPPPQWQPGCQVAGDQLRGGNHG